MSRDVLQNNLARLQQWERSSWAAARQQLNRLREQATVLSQAAPVASVAKQVVPSAKPGLIRPAARRAFLRRAAAISASAGTVRLVQKRAARRVLLRAGSSLKSASHRLAASATLQMRRAAQALGRVLPGRFRVAQSASTGVTAGITKKSLALRWSSLASLKTRGTDMLHHLIPSKSTIAFAVLLEVADFLRVNQPRILAVSREPSAQGVALRSAEDGRCLLPDPLRLGNCFRSRVWIPRQRSDDRLTISSGSTTLLPANLPRNRSVMVLCVDRFCTHCLGGGSGSNGGMGRSLCATQSPERFFVIPEFILTPRANPVAGPTRLLARSLREMREHAGAALPLALARISSALRRASDVTSQTAHALGGAVHRAHAWARPHAEWQARLLSRRARDGSALLGYTVASFDEGRRRASHAAKQLVFLVSTRSGLFLHQVSNLSIAVFAAISAHLGAGRLVVIKVVEQFGREVVALAPVVLFQSKQALNSTAAAASSAAAAAVQTASRAGAITSSRVAAARHATAHAVSHGAQQVQGELAHRTPIVLARASSAAHAAAGAAAGTLNASYSAVSFAASRAGSHLARPLPNFHFPRLRAHTHATSRLPERQYVEAPVTLLILLVILAVSPFLRQLWRRAGGAAALSRRVAEKLSLRTPPQRAARTAAVDSPSTADKNLSLQVISELRQLQAQLAVMQSQINNHAALLDAESASASVFSPTGYAIGAYDEMSFKASPESASFGRRSLEPEAARQSAAHATDGSSERTDETAQGYELSGDANEYAHDGNGNGNNGDIVANASPLGARAVVESESAKAIAEPPPAMSHAATDATPAALVASRTSYDTTPSTVSAATDSNAQSHSHSQAWQLFSSAHEPSLKSGARSASAADSTASSAASSAGARAPGGSLYTPFVSAATYESTAATNQVEVSPAVTNGAAEAEAGRASCVQAVPASETTATYAAVSAAVSAAILAVRNAAAALATPDAPRASAGATAEPSVDADGVVETSPAQHKQGATPASSTLLSKATSAPQEGANPSATASPPGTPPGITAATPDAACNAASAATAPATVLPPTSPSRAAAAAALVGSPAVSDETIASPAAAAAVPSLSPSSTHGTPHSSTHGTPHDTSHGTPHDTSHATAADAVNDTVNDAAAVGDGHTLTLRAEASKLRTQPQGRNSQFGLALQKCHSGKSDCVVS